MKLLVIILGLVVATSAIANEKQCLAEAIYHEARGESEEAQVAVAHVILNRVKSNKFPDTICGVVKQAKRDNAGKLRKYKCQFSFYCDGRSDKMHNKRAATTAQRLANIAIRWHETGEDFSHGSLFYHTKAVSPSWSKVFSKTVTIDNHIFYDGKRK